MVRLRLKGTCFNRRWLHLNEMIRSVSYVNAAMYESESIYEASVNRGVSDDSATKSRRRGRSAEPRTAIDDTSTAERSSNSEANNDGDDDDDDDQIRRTKSSTGYSIHERHRHDDVITPVRRVTSDVTGTPLRHSTPMITRHDVVGRTPVTVRDPNLSGIDRLALYTV